MSDPARPRADDRRILGIDPGTRLLGWGVVAQEKRRLRAVGFGVIRAAPRLDLPRRLVLLAAGLREVIAEYAPEEAAIEEAFHGRDARAALRLGEARGAVLLLLAEAGLEVTGYANNVVKRAVSGAGRASKERVQSMVVRLLALAGPAPPFDASDALAVALCHHQRAQHGAGGGGIPPRLAAAIRAAEGRRGR